MIDDTVSAPERTKRHAASTSRTLSPTKWNSSVSTADDVVNGNRRVRNASAHGSCQRSLRSSSAKIAPVSASALAGTAPGQSRPDQRSRTCCPARVASRDGTEELCRRGVQPGLLVRVTPAVAAARLEPLRRDPVQECCERGAFAARFVLQLGLHNGGHAPAVDFRLPHALHRSASRCPRQSSAERLQADGGSYPRVSPGRPGDRRASAAAPAPLHGEKSNNVRRGGGHATQG